MKLSVTENKTFEDFIDPAFSPQASIVGRYRGLFRFGPDEEDAAFKQTLLTTSLREGARIFPLLKYNGVEIHILDESSLMHSGTLKSIDGAFAAAKCKMLGYERVVFESGGNTGTALTEYCGNAGLETFCFIPEDNLPLLDSSVFSSPKAHLISVAEPGMVKRSARLLDGVNGIHHIPKVGWRYEASRFRGCFILEHSRRNGSFDWLVQTISAAFGPIGIYSVLNAYPSGGPKPPRFLGIQQEANCPMYKAWKSGKRDFPDDTTPNHGSSNFLTRVMYDVEPQTYGTYEDLERLLIDTRGDLTTVNHMEFSRMLDLRFDGRDLFDLLAENGVRIGMREGEVIEKTGLIALAGTLKGISNGIIGKGSKVLCCLTSGTRPGDGMAKAEYRVADPEKLLTEYRAILDGHTD